jgi:hypothetical protein
VIQKASIAHKRLAEFFGQSIKESLLLAPSIQKVIRRRRWNQAAYSRGALLVDNQLRGRLREASFYLSGTDKAGTPGAADGKPAALATGFDLHVYQKCSTRNPYTTRSARRIVAGRSAIILTALIERFRCSVQWLLG